MAAETTPLDKTIFDSLRIVDDAAAAISAWVRYAQEHPEAELLNDEQVADLQAAVFTLDAFDEHMRGLYRAEHPGLET